MLLADDGLIRGQRDAFGEDVNIMEGVTPAGLRALNEWPSEQQLADVLPDLLKALAEQADDPEEVGS